VHGTLHTLLFFTGGSFFIVLLNLTWFSYGQVSELEGNLLFPRNVWWEDNEEIFMGWRHPVQLKIIHVSICIKIKLLLAYFFILLKSCKCIWEKKRILLCIFLQFGK
jgi:hypothetical protein